MRVIVTVKERFEEARQVIGRNLSGKYIIHLPDIEDTDTATSEAVRVCRELLSIEDDDLLDLHGRRWVGEECD